MISNAISDSRSRLMEQNKLMLTTLKDVYRKFHLGHDNIGSEELMSLDDSKDTIIPITEIEE